MNLAGLILAAGASRRMGPPKALLHFGGETFLDRLVGALGSSCSPVIVVLGFHSDAIRNGVRRAGEATFVLNPDPDRGQLSSLQCGLAALPTTADGVMFTPVDYPAVKPATVSALADAFLHRAGGQAVIVPRFEGKRGHPVAIAREVVEEILALPLEAQARDVIRRHAERTLHVDVDDPGILQDVDDPDAYRRLAEAADPS